MASDLTGAIRSDPEDDRAWNAWFRGIYPQVLYILARQTSGNVDVAEEATQGAIERFLRYGAYERVGNDRSAVAYLARSAMRLIIDDQRRQRESPLPEEDFVGDGREMDVPVAGDELASLLGHLSDQDREVVEMVVLGYSVREISEALQLRYSTVGMRIHRAKARLRALVGDM